jgi:hypothetical protein
MGEFGRGVHWTCLTPRLSTSDGFYRTDRMKETTLHPSPSYPVYRARLWLVYRFQDEVDNVFLPFLLSDTSSP